MFVKTPHTPYTSIINASFLLILRIWVTNRLPLFSQRSFASTTSSPDFQDNIIIRCRRRARKSALNIKKKLLVEIKKNTIIKKNMPDSLRGSAGYVVYRPIVILLIGSQCIFCVKKKSYTYLGKRTFSLAPQSFVTVERCARWGCRSSIANLEQ